MSLSIDASLKVPNYLGSDNVSFKEYSAKMLAVGAIQGGFDDALLNDLDIAATAANRNDNIKKRNLAWGYLTMSLGGATAMVLDQVTTKNPHTAWEHLNIKYAATSPDAYTQVAQELENCTLESSKEDPDEWIARLMAINARLGSIGATYRKNDLEMISLIMHRLPQDTYKDFINFMNMAGYSATSLDDFGERLKQYWRVNVKWIKEREDTQVTMSAKITQEKSSSTSMEDAIVDKLMKRLAIGNHGYSSDQGQGNFRSRRTVKFCSNCNKRGHTIKECWEAGGGREGQRPDINTVRCNRCGNLGHFPSQCKFINPPSGTVQPPQQSVLSVGSSTQDDDFEDFFAGAFLVIPEDQEEEECKDFWKDEDNDDNANFNNDDNDVEAIFEEESMEDSSILFEQYNRARDLTNDYYAHRITFDEVAAGL